MTTPAILLKRPWLAAVGLGLFWFAGIGTGLKFLWAYESTPGLAANAPSRWPSKSSLAPPSSHPTLVMLVHPHCPCSRASISELDSLMTKIQGRVSAYVLFYRPSHFAESWVKTDLWTAAARIPGVTPVIDLEGREAERFGAATSGQTMLYDARGRLVFSGGITSARGHVGDNAGRQAIADWIINAVRPRQPAAVFGCPIRDSSKSLTRRTT